MKKYPHSFNYAVPEYDCDALLNLKPSAVLRYMQRAATSHLDEVNLPYEVLLKENIVFMMASMGVKFYNKVPINQEIHICTGPVKAKGAQMLRETVLRTVDGEVLVEGQASWVMVNPITKKVLRSSAFTHQIPTVTEYTPFCDITKVKIPLCEGESQTRVVRFSHLDRNQHMNNTVYADLLCDAFSDILLAGGEIDSFFIKYKSQARLNDEITLFKQVQDKNLDLTAKLGDDTCFVGRIVVK